MSLPSATPSLSVVMPVYNAAPYIGAALDSILAQTLPVTEIIVVDDGSSDGSADVAATRPGVTVIRQPNRGAATALNRGVEAATGEYLTFLDADDLWSETKLARQFSVLTSPPPVDLVFGHAQNFHSPDIDEALRRTIYCPPDPLPGLVISTMFLRRDTFHRVGYLKADWKIGYHIEWYARAQDLGLVTTMLPDVVLRRRLHANNISRREKDSRPDFARILKFVLDRRRQKKEAIALF